MALGTNYKRIGRKQDLILQIQIARIYADNLDRYEAVKSTKGYNKYHVNTLIVLLKEALRKVNKRKGKL